MEKPMSEMGTMVKNCKIHKLPAQGPKTMRKVASDVSRYDIRDSDVPADDNYVLSSKKNAVLYTVALVQKCTGQHV